MVRNFCQFKKKLQSAQINGKGHIYCLYMNNNKELPRLFVADLNEIYSEYSAYSWMLKLGYKEKKAEKVVVNRKEQEGEQKEMLTVELTELNRNKG